MLEVENAPGDDDGVLMSETRKRGFEEEEPSDGADPDTSNGARKRSRWKDSDTSAQVTLCVAAIRRI